MFDTDCAGSGCVFDQHHKVNSIVDVIHCAIVVRTRGQQREFILVDDGRVAFSAYSSPIHSWVLPRSRRTARYLLLVIGVGAAEGSEHD
jgi:hypothetical protein